MAKRQLCTGTVLAGDINPGTANAFRPGRFESATVFNNRFYFKAENETYGVELWQVHSVGTVQLAGEFNSGGLNSSPDYPTANEQLLFFSSVSSTNGTEPDHI